MLKALHLSPHGADIDDHLARADAPACAEPGAVIGLAVGPAGSLV
jgi:hypothetical protein